MYPLFVVAVGVVAVHVVDDSFVQPEPGTSAGDHLVSGLVPLAALGLAVYLFPRVRPRAQATIALLAGLFGIVTGLEGWHYTTQVGASGDDYTGVVALPAGVILVVIGVATLWLSRRTDGSLPRRWLRRAGIGVAALIAVTLLVRPFLESYGYTHLARAVVPEPDLGGADYQDVSFETSDGLELQGWYIPSRNRAAVIAFPGRSGTREPARFLARHGYGVLLFDRRGEGDSEGEPNALGWGGDRDIEAAIAFLESRPDVDPRADRRHRAVGRGRAADPGGRRERRPEGDRVRRGRDSLASRGERAERRGEVVHPPGGRGADAGHGDLLQQHAAAEPEGAGRPNRPAAGVPDLRRARSAASPPSSTRRSARHRKAGLRAKTRVRVQGAPPMRRAPVSRMILPWHPATGQSQSQATP